ncbi:MAG: hypothetical protein ABIC68_08050 [Candidatus Omnitrophota bacterium]
MKKLVLVVLAGLFLTAFSSYARAEDVAQQQEQMGATMKHHEGMMKHDKMKDPGKMAKMFRAMMIKNMVATEDGGVIVLVGSKLQKYDKDLVLQKEVEIKVDAQDMQDMMSHCPMKNTGLKAEKEEAGEVVLPTEVKK